MIKRRIRHAHPEDDTDENWMRSHWRPAMAWSYMVICLFDFIIAPSGVAFLITFHNSSIPAWQSLTLSNGGIMHLAFGAILGVSAWGRTKESVTSIQTGPFGPGVVTVDTQTEVVTPKRKPPKPVDDTDDEDVVVVPKPRPPVID